MTQRKNSGTTVRLQARSIEILIKKLKKALKQVKTGEKILNRLRGQRKKFAQNKK